MCRWRRCKSAAAFTSRAYAPIFSVYLELRGRLGYRFFRFEQTVVITSIYIAPHFVRLLSVKSESDEEIIVNVEGNDVRLSRTIVSTLFSGNLLVFEYT